VAAFPASDQHMSVDDGEVRRGRGAAYRAGGCVSGHGQARTAVLAMTISSVICFRLITTETSP
jgi:hypothetical protein